MLLRILLIAILVVVVYNLIRRGLASLLPGARPRVDGRADGPKSDVDRSNIEDADYRDVDG